MEKEDIFELRHTYNEWLSLGCQVQRGEKSIGLSQYGMATFGIWQTLPETDYDYLKEIIYSEWLDDLLYDDCMFGTEEENF